MAGRRLGYSRRRGSLAATSAPNERPHEASGGALGQASGEALAERPGATAGERLDGALDEVRRDWTTLGAADPLWAVLVRPGGWELEEFLATGRADVAATVDWLAELGRPTRWQRALDFGCGVGRLSQALAGYADEVIGVDISATMLEAARRIDRTGRCTFVRNDSADLRQFPDGHADLVYSVLVLQHLPRPVIEVYLAELLRVLRADGTAVIQVPTRTLWTVRGLAWRLVPFPVLRWVQRRLLGYPAPMRMTVLSDAELTGAVTRSGGRVLARRTDPTDSKDFQLTRYVIGRGD